MKIKILILSMTIILYSSLCFGFDLIFEIPDNKLSRVKTAFLDKFPNNECLIYKANNITCETYKHTDNEWVIERIRRLIRDEIKAEEKKDTINSAVQSMPTDYDTLIIVP